MYGTHRITVDQTITLNKKDCCTYICFCFFFKSGSDNYQGDK